MPSPPGVSSPTLDLSPERWKQIQRLFEQALELPAVEQEAFLEEACGDDSRLRLQVEGMLRAEKGGDARLEGVIRGTLELAAAEEARALRRIGPYQVLGELGRGGMSTVYLAVRADEHYRKQVAVKVVRRGMDSRDILLHLRRERQILARLDHPYIAKLLDGGNTEDGLPYFVMDHVDGEPIDRYCDARRLRVKARLELFLQVCSAVQYAHGNLVIHRDLKPNNLLVTADGRPQLLDFGIAKLLNPEEDPELFTELATPTATGLRLLTPEYASPEQVRGEPLTTATDVYSLGVLLYELLTGHRPFEVDRRRYADLERAICETQPPRPSLSAAGSEEGRSAASHARSSTPERLRRRLAGDLDNVVLTALRKEPERRYGSVEQLAGDLRRHLDGHPVSARPDTLGYRASKFVRRHRRVLGAAVAVLLLMASLVGFYTARLAVERDRARQEERKATQVANLLMGLFDGADPEHALGEEIGAREVLDVGAARIRAELAEDPELKAELMDRIATIYMRLGHYDSADPLLEESADLRQRLYGSEHPEVASSEHQRGRWLQAKGELPRAEQVYRDALAMRERTLGAEHAAVADSLTDLADLLYTRGEFAEAGELFERTLVIRRQQFGPEHPALATSLNDLGAVMYAQRKLEPAEKLLRQALEIRVGHFAALHPAIAETQSTLASVLARRGNVDEAETLYRDALQARRQVYGDRHPIVARSLNNLGNHLRRLGRYAEAEPLLREAVEIFRHRPAAHQVDFVRGLGNLSVNLQAQERFEEAEQVAREALQVARATLSPEHPDVAVYLMNLGDALLDLARLSEAGDVYQQALAIRQSHFPADHWRIASPLLMIGRVQLEQDRSSEAEAVLRQARTILGASRPGHLSHTEATVLLGIAVDQLSRPRETETLLREAEELLQANPPSAGPEAEKYQQLVAEVERMLNEL